MAHYYDRATGELSATPHPGWLSSVSTILQQTRPFDDVQALEGWFAADIFTNTQTNRLSQSRGMQLDLWIKAYLRRQALPLVHLDYYPWVRSVRPHLDVLLAQSMVDQIDVPVLAENYAGTPDLVLEQQGKFKLIDFKTRQSPAVQAVLHEGILQCTAYAEAFRQQHGLTVQEISLVVIYKNFVKTYDYPAYLFLPHWQTRLNGYLSAQAAHQG